MLIKDFQENNLINKPKVCSKNDSDIIYIIKYIILKSMDTNKPSNKVEKNESYLA